MQNIRKLPVGIQTFEKLREGGYLYIDKTDFVYNLVHTGQVYFLSRPRRFGKSLLLSTFKAYFEGRKELFEGLKIAELEKENPDAWKKYPVIYLNFAQDNFSEKKTLGDCINLQLEEYERKYGITEKPERFAGRFMNIVKTVREKTGMQAAVLIDEYDKPLLDAQNNEELTGSNRETLKGLYITLKALDENLKFVLLTGVTKFSKVSIFSDLNQLNDISMNEQFAEICGITEEEMISNLEPEIKAMAEKNQISEDECVQKLKQMYDGYHFHHNGKGVYNPFSLINALYAKEFSLYTNVSYQETEGKHDELHGSFKRNRGDGAGASGLQERQSGSGSAFLPDRLSYHKGLRPRVRRVPSEIPERRGEIRVHKFACAGRS